MSTFFESKENISKDNSETYPREDVKDLIRKHVKGVLPTPYAGVMIQYNFNSCRVALVPEKVGGVEISYNKELFGGLLLSIKSLMQLMAKEQVLLYLYKLGDEKIVRLIQRNHEIDLQAGIVRNTSYLNAENTLLQLCKALKPNAIRSLFSEREKTEPVHQVIFKALYDYGVVNINRGKDAEAVINRISTQLVAFTSEEKQKQGVSKSSS